MAQRLVRAPVPQAILAKEALFLFGPRDEACALEGDHAELVLAVLEEAAAPLDREALVARILARAEADASARGAVEQAIDLAIRMGALVREEVRAAPAPSARARVLVGVTGAIAALYAPPLVERLVAEGHDVRVAMTRAARNFLRPRAFAAITHRSVEASMWRGAPDAPAPHIALARWADVMVVYPCTATTLARIATGECSELVAAVATTTRAPVLLAPSMNVEMIRAPAVAQNLALVRERGFYLAHPGMGVEVADAPSARAPRGGVAPPAAWVARYVSWLVDRAAAGAPRLLSREEWEREIASAASPLDQDFVDVLGRLSVPGARLLDVGTGTGAFAREGARRGHAVVGTDFTAAALREAAAAEGGERVTWVVDDITESKLVGSFDLVADRVCLGCIPETRQDRYLEAVARLVRPGGFWAVKVHASPAKNLRARGFERDALVRLAQPGFALVEARASTLSFGQVKDGPAWFAVFQRQT